MTSISRIDVYGYDLTYIHGEYVMSGGRVVNSLESTIVRVTTEEGIEGFGEVCPLGPAYLPAHAAGVRAALAELAPPLIGSDACNLAAVSTLMDEALMGHGYAKSALDTACWDLLGRKAGLSVCELLGGRRQQSFPLYVAVPLGPLEAMVAHAGRLRSEGIRRFQLKLGADPAEDAARVRAVVEAAEEGDVVIADANGGWRLQDAISAAQLLEGLPRLHLEQPCPTLEECLQVRRRTRLPMVLDESIADVQSLLRAWGAQGMEGINLKISKVGGLTKARLMRDLAESLGLGLTIEDTWGGDVTTAAISHLAASTSRDALFTVSFMNDWTNEHVAGYSPRSEGGRGRPPEGPGLGIEVDVELLGEPFFSVGRR
jgi:cis-L-3-hydroxyproline dehydratase